MVKGCSDTSTSNKIADCTRDIVKGLSGVDPTGLLSIAGAFMHGTCPTIQTLAEVDSESSAFLDLADEDDDIEDSLTRAEL